MKKIWILIINLLIFSIFIVQALPLNEYPVIKVAFITSGEAEQELKCFVDVKAGGVGHISPTTYTIGEDGKIYIADDEKRRIAVYDLDGNYIRQIKSDKVYLGYLYAVKVDKNGIIFCLANGEILFIKLKANGDLIYKTNGKNASGIYQGFFPYEDYVFYYDKKHKIKCLNPQGENMTDEEINNLLASIKLEDEKTGVRSINSIQPTVDKFLNKESLVFINDKLYTNSMSDYIKLWNTIGNNEDIKKIKETYREMKILESDKRAVKMNLTKGNIITVENMKEYTRYGGKLIGYDQDGNSLWAGSGVIVMDKYHNVIDVFKVSGAEILYPMQVAPNGDFYFWKIAREGVTFYKVTRRW